MEEQNCCYRGDDGEWIHGKHCVKNRVVNYFFLLFLQKKVMMKYMAYLHISFPNFHYINGISLASLSLNRRLMLLSRLWAHLRLRDPMGFKSFFIKKNWELGKSNVYDNVFHMLEGKTIPNHLNETHIVLLLKIYHPKAQAQFCPIGLCNITYKIITKIIVNRIKPLLKLISNTQGSFIPGRLITDKIIIQEVNHTMKKKAR